MKLICFAFLLLCAGSQIATSQWKKISRLEYAANTGGNSDGFVESIYFLDIPGPLRVGFVGATGNIWKTTDGGISWRQVGDFPGHISGFSFKDTSVGWFALGGDPSYIFKTTNQGETWFRLGNTAQFGGFVSYLPVSQKVYTRNNSGFLMASTNFGVTWGVADSFYVTCYASTSDKDGLFFFDDLPSAGFLNAGFLITHDGGFTFDTVYLQNRSDLGDWPQILGIHGTSTFFEAAISRGTIHRSDDFGKTWRIVHQTDTGRGPGCTGRIVGDLSRLYYQTDSGMFVSTDEGVTWKNEGGPELVCTACGMGIYAAKGKAFTGQSYAYQNAWTGGGLWEEEYQVAGVKHPVADTDFTVYPNPASSIIHVQSLEPRIVAMDVLGRSYLLANRDGSVDISVLPSGTYYVRLTTSYGETRTVKIVKQ